MDQSVEVACCDSQVLMSQKKNWTKNTWIMIKVGTIYSEEVGREQGVSQNSNELGL